MGTLTIRNLDDALKARLRVRAAARSLSMEEEARQILRAALEEHMTPSVDLGAQIRARFAGLGGLDIVIEPREEVRSPAGFAKPVSGRTRQASKAKRAR